MAEREQLLESERAARNEAERLGHLKDEFLATLSHELRTPLTAILGWCSVLRRKKNLTEADLKDAIETIHRNAKSQAQIIEDLLDMSRIVSGKIRLETDNIDLGDLVQVAVDGIRPSAAAKNITIRLLRDADAGAGPRRRRATATDTVEPADQRREVHARRRTDPRHGAARERPGGTDGAGLGHRHSSRISCPLCSSVSARPMARPRASMAALGLGLSIVRNLVELHGGSITAESPGENLGQHVHRALAGGRPRAPWRMWNGRGDFKAAGRSRHLPQWRRGPGRR